MLINKNVYFVHVPRTGGRYITNLFKINKHEVSLDAFNTKWKNKEIGHLTYPDYEVYLNFLKCTKFAVIRDPITRFLSAINSDVKLNKDTIDTMLSSQENLNLYLNNLIFNDDDNWYTPQINFLNYDVKIYKYENGLGDKFVEWINNNFNLKLEIFDARSFSEVFEINLTNKQKQYVENYYYKDFRLLNY